MSLITIHIIMWVTIKLFITQIISGLQSRGLQSNKLLGYNQLITSQK